MTDFAMDDPSFYEDFLVEAAEHFEQIETNFLALEDAPGDLDLLNAIFRSVHTIKGASGFLGLNKVQALAHVGENILDNLRKGRMQQTEEVTEILFETVDVLKVLVGDVGVAIRKQGTPQDPDTTDLIARLEFLNAGGSGAAKTAPKAEPKGELVLPPELQGIPQGPREAAAKSLSEGKAVMGVLIELDSAIYGTHFNPFSVFQMAELVGHLLHSQALVREPELDLENFDPKRFYLDLVMLVELSDSEEMVRKVFGNLANAKVHYHALALGAPAASAPAPKAEAPKPEAPAAGPVASGPTSEPAAEDKKAGRKAAEAPAGGAGGGDATIRVSQTKLDHFMNIVAELIISKTMISHLVERLGTLTDGEAAEVVKELSHASVYLDHVSKEIQSSVLGIRMVPVKTVFGKFPRMVRDLAKMSGKKIELQMTGEDTEIDKSIIEELGDPMIHLIRNSCDHGVETPEARRERGKPETGTVVLRARHEGDSVVVEIEDDGKGIDPVIIRAKAVEKGLITQERADSMTDEEAVDMIFLPGFSTAAKITDISGRGVGMDVVRSNVRKLNGSVGVRSVVGKGSVFTIKLPLTLAIIDALLVRTGGQVFAIPGTAVEETLVVAPETLSHLTRRKAMNLRGEVLGVCKLHDLLKFQDRTVANAEEGLSIVVVTASGRRMGLVVDTFVRRQEVVIKPLAPYLASLPGISGASIMGDGGVVLILDPLELMQLAIQEAL